MFVISVFLAWIGPLSKGYGFQGQGHVLDLAHSDPSGIGHAGSSKKLEGYSLGENKYAQHITLPTDAVPAS